MRVGRGSAARLRPHPTDLTMTDFWQELEIQIIIRIGLALRLRLGNPGLIGMGFHNG